MVSVSKDVFTPLTRQNSVQSVPTDADTVRPEPEPGHRQAAA